VPTVPFRRLEHLVTVPVSVDGLEARFVLDTGIGVTLLSSALAASVGCAPDGRNFTPGD
jgi:2-methylisocitrate lyase-like PEP mutase family enzyme